MSTDVTAVAGFPKFVYKYSLLKCEIRHHQTICMMVVYESEFVNFIRNEKETFELCLIY